MMSTASKYPVTFGYNQWWGSYLHRGEDRALPVDKKGNPIPVPLVINGTKVGMTGSTGKSSGHHVHLQVGKDPWAQQTVKPTNHWFKGTEVVTTGTASEWGNYVIVKNGAYYCVYAHLSKISVKKGDKLGMYNGKTAKQWWQRAVELDESRNAWRDTARKLQTKVDKIAGERDLLNAKLTQIEKELKSCQDAVQALRSAESAKPVKDTTDDPKPQIDTSTQARGGVWDWLVDLFNKLRRN